MGLDQQTLAWGGPSLLANADSISMSAPPSTMPSQELAFLAPTSSSSSLPLQGRQQVNGLRGMALSSTPSSQTSTLFWVTSALAAAVAFGHRRRQQHPQHHQHRQLAAKSKAVGQGDVLGERQRQRSQRRLGAGGGVVLCAAKTSVVDTPIDLTTKRPGHSTFIAKLRLNEVVPSPSELMALFQPPSSRSLSNPPDSPDAMLQGHSASFTTASPAPTSPTRAGSSISATASSSAAQAQADATTAAALDLSVGSGSRFPSAAPVVDEDEGDLDEESNAEMWSGSSWSTTEGPQEHSDRAEVDEPESLRLAYEKCKDITKEYSKTFFLASKMLPPDQRRAVWAVYNWCRMTDELVDGPASQVTTLSDLAEWEMKLQDAFLMSQGPLPTSEDWQQLSFADSIRRFNLSSRPYEDMIAGVSMDLAKNRYQSFEELKLYCYRVAGTVGLMMLPILNGQEASEELIASAMALGTAFQLTNILRDVGEDGRRGRIYLPLEDMRWFGVSEEDMLKASRGEIKGYHKTRQWEDFMEFQIQRCESFYKTALEGIPLLSENCRFCVLVAWKVYGGILESIRRNGYDNFQRRAYVSKPKKASLVAAARREAQEMAKQQ